MKIIIIEDEQKLAESMKKSLSLDGHEVALFFDGETALEYLSRDRSAELIVIDLMLPGISGFEVNRKIRAMGIVIPVMILTARDMVEDKVTALDDGADDFLTKPFSFEELQARIRAITRRFVSVPEKYSVYDIQIDTGKFEVSVRDKIIPLTLREFQLLHYLASRREQAVGRDELFEKIWGIKDGALSNVVDVHIRNLRKKIETDGKKIIRTVRGVGYTV